MHGMQTHLARRGALTARLTEGPRDIEAALRLRHRIFCEDGHALPSASGLEQDVFDPFCDHLLLECPEAGLIGTCRLLPEDRAAKGFYSATEFAVEELLVRHPGLGFLEIGRSCIAPSHRSGAAAQLLWQAIWTYFRARKLDVMMGCASLEGTDPALHSQALGFLGSHCLAPQEWDVRPVMPGIVLPVQETASRPALRALPPLLKGYVRLGAYVASQAVVDEAFGTTDVFVVLPLSRIDPRYFNHFGAPNH